MLKKYFRIYFELMRLNAAVITAYRGNFINSVLVSLGWSLFSFISIMLLTSKSTAIFGWSKEELLILTGVYSIIIGLFHVLFSRNLEQVSRIVHRGQLDSFLLKPIDAQFLLSLTRFNYSSIPRVIMAILIVGLLIWQQHINIHFYQIMLFFVFGISSLIFLYSIWFLILSITVVYSQLSNLSDLLSHINDSAKYPVEMYSELRYYITIFLVPIAMIVSLPTKILLLRASLFELISLVLLTISIFMLSRLSFKFALRFYASVNS